MVVRPVQIERLLASLNHDTGIIFVEGSSEPAELLPCSPRNQYLDRTWPLATALSITDGAQPKLHSQITARRMVILDVSLGVCTKRERQILDFEAFNDAAEEVRNRGNSGTQRGRVHAVRDACRAYSELISEVRLFCTLALLSVLCHVKISLPIRLSSTGARTSGPIQKSPHRLFGPQLLDNCMEVSPVTAHRIDRPNPLRSYDWVSFLPRSIALFTRVASEVKQNQPRNRARFPRATLP